MGLFDLAGFVAEKAYGKYKESKLESAMDMVLSSMDSCSLNFEVLPYSGEDDNTTVKGMVYRLSKEAAPKSSALYFLTTPNWLLKGGIDINDDKVYVDAFKEKSGYLYVNLLKQYPELGANFRSKYNLKGVGTSLFLYMPEGEAMLSIPRYIKDPKKGDILLSKRANNDDLAKIEKALAEGLNGLRSNLHFRAKMFAYRLANELNEYDKTSLDNAFRKFEEKKGPGGVVEYRF